MIWQLLKRDRLWRPGALMSIVVAVLIVMASAWIDLPPRVSSREVFRSELSIFLSIEAAVLILIGYGVYTLRDLYEAALPLDGRDIRLSRLLALLLVAWLPVPIGIAGGLPPLTLLAGASFTTALSLCGQCYRIREVGATRRVFKLIVPLIFLVPACVVFFGHAFRSVHWPPMPTAGTVLTASGFVSLLLFGYGWRSVPRSFTIARLDLPGSARSEGDERPMFILAPVFRSVNVSPSMLLIFAFVVIGMVKGLGIAFLAAIPLQIIPFSSRWLLALPISRRKLFALVAAAPAAAIIVGSIAAALFSRGNPYTPQERIAGFAADLASVYFVVFLIELRTWRPLWGLRTWVKWFPFGVAFFAMPLVSAENVFSRLEHATPRDSWPLFFLLPAASYWLAEKAFIEQEYPRPLAQTNQQRSLSI